MRIKKGDTVSVITGKDKGKKGKILKVYPRDTRVLVEGVNFSTVFTRRSQDNPKGGITKVESKLPVSNVQLVCPKCSKLTRIGIQMLADGSKQRICKKCHEII